MHEANRVVGDKTQPDMRNHGCDVKTMAKVLTMMAMFFFTTFTPAQRIENKFLISALSLRGVTLPDRKQLIKDHLPACYNVEYQKFLEELKSFNGTYQIATDGWKRRSAESGVPLVNYMILFPCGKSKMWSVISAAGHSKNAEWIAADCLSVFTDIQAAMGPNAKCAGFVMDNTAANRKAMRIIETAHPHMCCIGCVSHALSLLIKDFAKRLMWLGTLYAFCVSVSNMANGVEAMKHALNTSMSALGVIRTICSHVETRFGSQHMVLKSVRRNQDALRAWVVSSGYVERMSQPSPPAAGVQIKKGILDIDAETPEHTFDNSLRAACALIDPIMDIMHEIEGDKPYLSQMLVVIDGCVASASQFVAKHDLSMSEGLIKKKGKPDVETDVVQIVQTRMLDFVYRPCMSLAFLLDPSNFVQLCGEFVPPFSKLAPEGIDGATDTELYETRYSDAVATVEAIGGEKAKADFLRFQLSSFSGSPQYDMLVNLTALHEEELPHGGTRTTRAKMSARRNFWLTFLSMLFPDLVAVAVTLLSMHTTACAAERNWSKWGLLYSKNRARMARHRAMQMIFLSENNGFVLTEESDVLDLSVAGDM